MAQRSYEKAVIQAKPGKSYEAATIPSAGISGNKAAGDYIDPEILKKAVAVPMFQGATAEFGDDAVGMINEQAGQDIRDIHEQSKQDYPVSSFISQNVGEQINPLTRVGSIRKNMVMAALKVFGASEDKMSAETAKNATTSAALSYGLDRTGGFLSKKFLKDPNTTRAKVLGTSTTEFRDTGLNKREEVAKRLKEDGFLSPRPVQFNVQTMKSEPIAEKASKGILQKPTSQVLFDRADKDLDIMGKESKFILEGASRNGAVKIPMPAVVADIESTVEKYLQKFPGDSEARKKLEDIAEDLYVQLVNVKKPSTEFPLGRATELAGGPEVVQPEMLLDPMALYRFKRNLQDMVVNYGKDPNLKRIPLQDDFYEEIAYKLGKTLSDNIPDKRLKTLGLKQHDRILAQRDLAFKISRQKSTGFENPDSLLRNDGNALMKNAGELLMGGDEGLMKNANATEYVDNMAQKYPWMKDFVKQGFQGIPREMGTSRERSRSPQSVPNVPEQLLKMKLPRTVEGILQNKHVVLAKIAQQDPNMYAIMKEFIEERPEELGDLLPKLIASSPSTFERDPYNRVDNKVQDQNSKLKAINDTMRRDDLTNTEKIAIVNNLNKTGEFLDYKGGQDVNN